MTTWKEWLIGLKTKSSTFSISNVLIIVLLLVVVFGGWFFVKQLESYQKLLGIAEANFKMYQEVKTKYDSLEVARLKQSIEIDRRQAVLVKQRDDRKKTTEKSVQDVTRTSLTLPEVAKLAEVHLGELPTIEQNKLLFSQATIQDVLAIKVRLDAAEADKIDIQEQLYQEQRRSSDLQASLNAAKDALVAAEKSIQSYQKVVKKTKFQIFKDIGKNIGLTLLGIGVGSLLR